MLRQLKLHFSNTKRLDTDKIVLVCQKISQWASDQAEEYWWPAEKDSKISDLIERIM